MQESWLIETDRKLEKLLLDTPLLITHNMRADELAHLLDLPRYRLTYYLTRHLGRTYKQWLNEQRIELYLTRVDGGELAIHSVEGLARDCGFHTKSNFYKQLMRMHGQVS